MPYVEIIEISPDGSVPPRPTPQPPLTIWGPGDPRPTHPIFGFDPIHGTWPDRPQPPLGIWGPGDPRPTHPIAGFDPIHGTWPDRPTGPPGSAGSSVAVVKAVPPSMMPDPPPTPPAGSPTGTQLMMIWFGPGTLPTVAWVPPYADQSPPKPQGPTEPAPQA